MVETINDTQPALSTGTVDRGRPVRRTSRSRRSGPPGPTPDPRDQGRSRTADTTMRPKVWPVKHSPLLRAPERFVSRPQIRELIERLPGNLVAIEDESGEFLLRLDDGRVIDTKGWAGWEWTHGVGLYGIWQYYNQTGD